MKISTTYSLIAVVSVLVIMMLIYIIWCCMKKENFRDEDLIEKYKSLDVKVFYSPHCGFCREYKELLKKYNLTDYTTFVDVSKTRGKLEFETHGEPGVPVTYSEKTENKVAGLPKNMDDVITKLQDK